MLSRRIGDLRRLEVQLRRCCAELTALPATTRSSQRNAAPAKTSRPTRNRDHAFKAEEEDPGTRNELLRQRLTDVRCKLLFRKIPVALSRLERFLVVPTARRKFSAAALRCAAEAPVCRLSGSPRDLAVHSTSHASNTLSAGTAANKASEDPYHLLRDLGVLTPRGPFWSLAVTANEQLASSTTTPVSTGAARTVLRALHTFEQERRAFIKEEEQLLMQRFNSAARHLHERSAALVGSVTNPREKAQRVEEDSFCQEQRGKMDQCSSQLHALRASIVGRPFVSLFMWKAILQPEFLAAALGIAVCRFGEKGASVVLLDKIGEDQLSCAVAVGRLVLSLMGNLEGLNSMSPRFVVSYKRSSSTSKLTASWLPQPLSKQALAPLTWATVHVLTEFLRGSVHSNITPDDSATTAYLQQCGAKMLELVHCLQAMCQSLVVLDASSVVGRKDAMKSALLDSCNALQLDSAAVIIRLGHVSFVPSLSAEQTVRLIVSLFRLRVFDPDNRQCLRLAAVAFLTLFPILSSNTYRTMLAKLDDTVLSKSVARRQRSARRHAANVRSLSPTAIAAMEQRDNLRLQTKRIASALKLRRMTEFYSKSVAVVQPQPLSSIVVLYQVACMTSSAPRLPASVRVQMLGSVCMIGEALLDAVASTVERDTVGSISMHTFITLFASTCAVLPMAKQQSDASWIARKSTYTSGEYYFISKVAAYLLRCMSAKLVDAVESTEAHLDAPQQRGKSVSGDLAADEGFLLRSLTFLCDVLRDAAESCNLPTQRKGHVLAADDDRVAPRHLSSCIKAFLLSRSSEWWANETSTVRRDEKAVWARRVREALICFEMWDAVMEESLHRNLHISVQQQ